MKYYTETIPVSLAEELKEKGMPYIEIDCETYDSGTEYQRNEVWCNNTYAEVFDWLMSEKEIEVEVYLSMTRLDAAKNPVQKIYAWNVFSRHSEANGEEDEMTWHEAADAAIEKALTLI